MMALSLSPDDRAAIRPQIIDVLRNVEPYAKAGRCFAEAGDDTGLDYALARLRKSATAAVNIGDILRSEGDRCLEDRGRPAQ